MNVVSKHWMPAVVMALALASATALWLDYSPQWRQLWTDVVHDRNAHLEAGLGLAEDLAHGRIGGLISAIDRSRTWPPLHDVFAVAAAVGIGGLDPKFAVLPSLVAYVFAAVFAALAARRMSGDDIGGLVAGLLVLVSPAMRAFATDVMLEGPGACLTLAVLAAWMAARQEQTPVAWRRLAIALSALFFVKYNYWFLVVVAIGASSLLTPDGYRLSVGVARFVAANALPWLQRQLRHPLTYVILLLLAPVVWIRYLRGGDLSLFGVAIPMRTNANFGTAVYWAVLLRLGLWWRSSGHRLAADPRTAAVVRWHVVPILAWFAWPQKLASFLWVINPGENVGEFPVADRWGGYPFYFDAIANDYHAAPWLLGVVLALSAIALVPKLCAALVPKLCLGTHCRRSSASRTVPNNEFGLLQDAAAKQSFAAVRSQAELGNENRMLFATVALLLIAGVLTAHHPNRKSRFLHSWLPAVWVLAGAGAGVLASYRPPVTRLVVLSGVGGLGLALVPNLKPARAPEGGPQLGRSALDFTDQYLPMLADADRPAILSNVPLKFLARWTYLERYGRAIRPVTEVPGFDATRVCPENAAAFQRWLESQACDAIVLVELPAGSPWYVPVPHCEGLEQYGALLRGQSAWSSAPLPTTAELPAAITVWRRR